MLDRILVAALVGLAAYLFLRIVTHRLGRIKPTDARAKIAAGGLLLDVRSPSEFSSGALEGARNVPVQQLEGALTGLPKDRPIVVYCASGMRSARAVSRLKKDGVDAHDLGPMSAW